MPSAPPDAGTRGRDAQRRRARPGRARNNDARRRRGSSSLALRLRGELPPSGRLPALAQTLACRRWPYAYMDLCRARLGPAFTVYPIDMPPLVFLCDPRDIRAILTAPAQALHPGAGSEAMIPIFGADSFVLAEEDEHLRGRETVAPLFHAGIVDGLAGTLAELVASEVAAWPLGAPFALEGRLRRLTLRVMLAVAIGAGDPALPALEHSLLEMLSVSDTLLLQEPLLRRLPGGRARWRRFERHRRAADELIAGLIARRREERRERRVPDLLDALLEARDRDGSPLSERRIRDDFVSVIVAGEETTAAELGWAFQLLAHNRGAQERLIAEIDGGGEERYLRATIQETLRHRPAFLFTAPRVIAQPIEIGGRRYHPPARLLGCTYLLHHDPESYPAPHAFRPERFLEQGPPSGSLLPWGAGRKRCPGRHLALLEMRAVLREALGSRRVLPAASRIEHARWRSAILTPHAGSRVILQAR